jgi:hypothetical protein
VCPGSSASAYSLRCTRGAPDVIRRQTKQLGGLSYKHQQVIVFPVELLAFVEDCLADALDELFRGADRQVGLSEPFSS